MQRQTLRTRVARLDSGLVAYYPLNDVATDWQDAVGTNHLTASGSVAFGTGKLGDCLSIAADNRTLYALAAGTSIGAASSLFVSAWIQIADKTGTRTIMSRRNAGQIAFSLHYITASDNFQFFVSADGTNLTTRSSVFSGVTLNTWYWVCAWYDDVRKQIGIQVNDGAPDLTTASVALFQSTAAFRIGGRDDGGNWGRGLIDEVLVMSRIPTARERLALYNEGVGRTYPFFG